MWHRSAACRIGAFRESTCHHVPPVGDTSSLRTAPSTPVNRLLGEVTRVSTRAAAHGDATQSREGGMETAPQETTQVFQRRRAQVCHFIEQPVIEFATHVLDDLPHVAEVGDHSSVRVFGAFYRNLRVVSVPVYTTT